jgi:hypothetical protein
MEREAASSVGLAHEQWPPPTSLFSHNGFMVHHLRLRGPINREGEGVKERIVTVHPRRLIRIDVCNESVQKKLLLPPSLNI